jgi:adenine-specific DNA-methyltransferase
MENLPDELVQLINRFKEHLEQYKGAWYDEANTRTDFIDRLFELLGWDVANTAGYAEQYREVIREDKVSIEGATKAPDYCFRIGGSRKFFLEAKKPSVDLRSDSGPAYQLRRYAYSTRLPLSILTNFREFAVYDTRIKPNPNDGASAARIQYFTFEDYPQKWAFLTSTFSREAILHGAFDKYAEESIEDLISQSCSTPEDPVTLGTTTAEAHQEVLGHLSDMLGFHIDRIVKYDVDSDPMFWMEVNGSRRVRIGTVDVIVQQHKFSNKILSTVGEMIPDFDRQQWRKVATLIVKCAETAENVVDGRFDASVKDLIHDYLLAEHIEEDKDVGAALCQPFRKNDVVYIHIDSFIAWIYQTRHMNYLRQDLAQYLTKAGCVVRQCRFTMTKSGKKMSRNFWVVPPDLVPSPHRS